MTQYGHRCSRCGDQEPNIPLEMEPVYEFKKARYKSKEEARKEREVREVAEGYRRPDAGDRKPGWHRSQFTFGKGKHQPPTGAPKE